MPEEKPPKKSPPPKKGKKAAAAAGEVSFDAEGVGPTVLPNIPRETEQVVVVTPISDEDKVQLINTTLATGSFMLPQGSGYATVRVKPWEASPPMPITWALKVMGKGGKTDPKFAASGARFAGYHWRNWAPLVPAGEPNMLKFTEPTTGQSYQANKSREAGAISPDGKPLLHTEVQALNWIRSAPNNDMIAAFIHTTEGVDARPTVRMFAQDIMALRTSQDEERTEIQVVQRKRRVSR